MSRRPTHHLYVALALAALVACARGEGVTRSEADSTLPPSSDARGPTDAGSGPAETGPDARAPEAGDAGGSCVGQRVQKPADCGDDEHACDARLTLPGGGVFCTAQCATPQDCATHGADFVCAPDVGACMPRCASDASCVAAGFRRCDPTSGSCDTI